MPSCTRQSQRGAGLIVIIGIIAALAVMAASVVMLSGNVQHNTYRDRMQKTAFNVAEGAMDSAMYMLASDWPFTSATQPVFDADAFRVQYPEEDFPSPDGGGAFVTVEYYDNQDPVDKTITWDASGGAAGKPDNTMWLVVQANVGPVSTRIQSQVKMDELNLAMPRGIALFSEGDLLSSGGGNNPKIGVEVAPSTGEPTSVWVGGIIEEADVTSSDIAQNVGVSETLEDVFPTTLINALITLAEKHDRYFETADEALASPVDATYSPAGGLSGLTVINAAPAETVKVTANTQLNSEDKPGILMIVGGGTLEWGGTADYYGVIYCEGIMSTSVGTSTVHGMCLTGSNEEMKGTPNIMYNDKCIAKLETAYPSVVQLVPNTWRELHPTE
jgi:hypothetical protein